MSFGARSLFWLWMLCLAGCNIPPVGQPVGTREPLVSTPVSTRSPTNTPIPTFPSSRPSNPSPSLEPHLPSATSFQPIPGSSVTQQAGTPQHLSSQGSVVLQGDLCCVGGVVGTTVALRMDFVPPSSFSGRIEMRRKEGMDCLSEEDMASTPWEPFIATITEPYTITAINWIGYAISVQYRDSQGRISPVFCDEISVEGMPAPPEPTGS